jgi:hypothetical protein
MHARFSHEPGVAKVKVPRSRRQGQVDVSSTALRQVDWQCDSKVDEPRNVNLTPVKLTASAVDASQLDDTNRQVDSVKWTPSPRSQVDDRLAVKFTPHTVNLTGRQLDAVNLTSGTLPTWLAWSGRGSGDAGAAARQAAFSALLAHSAGVSQDGAPWPWRQRGRGGRGWGFRPARWLNRQ